MARTEVREGQNSGMLEGSGVGDGERMVDSTDAQGSRSSFSGSVSGRCRERLTSGRRKMYLPFVPPAPPTQISSHLWSSKAIVLHFLSFIALHYRAHI